MEEDLDTVDYEEEWEEYESEEDIDKPELKRI